MSSHKKNFFYSFLLNVLLTLTNIAASILIVRSLGPGGRGLYSVVNSIVSIFTIIINLGLPWSNTYYSSKNRDRIPVIFMNSFFYSCLVLIAVWGILTFFDQKLQFLLNKQIPPGAIGILIFLIPSVSFFQMINSILLGMNRVILYTQMNFFIYLAFLCYCTVCVIAGKFTNQAMLAMFLLAYLTVIAIASRKILKYYRVRLRFNAGYLFKNFKMIGFKAQTVNLMGALMQRADVLIINYFLGLEYAGYYSLALLLGQIVYQIPAILGNIIFPLSTDDTLIENTKQKIVKLSHFIIFTNIFLFALVLLFGRRVIGIFYGPDFSGCFEILLVLYPGFIFCSLAIILNSFLAGRGYPGAVFTSSAAAIGLSVALNLILIPGFSIIGSAMAFTASYFVMFLILAAHMSKNYGVGLLAFFLVKKHEYVDYAGYIFNLGFLKKTA